MRPPRSLWAGLRAGNINALLGLAAGRGAVAVAGGLWTAVVAGVLLVGAAPDETAIDEMMMMINVYLTHAGH